jgi:hypothetical protein
MLKTPKHFLIILALVVAGFGIAFYLQDRHHQKSTKVAWKANRFNLERFDEVRGYALQMDSANWQEMRHEIVRELDSFMILRFRREVDSLSALEPEQMSPHFQGAGE